MQKINNPCSYCKYRMEKMFNAYKHSCEEDKKYASFIISLGYATMITVFSTIHKGMNNSTNAVFIVCLTISILVFILNEIWKMLWNIKDSKYKNNLWAQNSRGELSLDDLEKKQQDYEIACFEIYNKFYPWIFGSSLLMGLVAVAIIFIVSITLIF